MKNLENKTTIWWIVIPQAVLMVVTSGVSAFTTNFYATETLNWEAQSIGQDIIDLFLVAPALLISAAGIWYGNKTSFFIWGGVNIYMVYTYLIFCFSVHFNQWFLFYCLLLGSSFYSLLYFLYVRVTTLQSVQPNAMVRKLTGWYLILISVVFYILWLSEIIPSVLNNQISSILTESGLFTNPVHVIDLSVVLPAIFITGVWVLNKKTIGYYLSSALLFFFILMNITIGVLTLVMGEFGFPVSYTLVIAMFILTLISIFLFIWLSSDLNSSQEKKIF